MTGLTQPWSINQQNPNMFTPQISWQQPFTGLPTEKDLPLFIPYSPTTALSGNATVLMSLIESHNKDARPFELTHTGNPFAA